MLRPYIPLIFALVTIGLWAARLGAGGPPLLHQTARPMKRPPGAPRHSDVIMRSLRPHPRNAKDPHDTIDAMGAFHVTRLEWTYLGIRHKGGSPGAKQFVSKVIASGRTFGGAASAPTYDRDIRDDTIFDNIVIKDRHGKAIIAPWKRRWRRTLWGFVSNPELQRGYLACLKRYIDAGAQVMHRDEPGANWLATHWGGCFCPNCMKAFRAYLAAHTTPQQRKKLGVAGLETFDYGKHLAGGRRPRALHHLFRKFQIHATVAFHKRTRKALNEYAGRRVPM